MNGWTHHSSGHHQKVEIDIQDGVLSFSRQKERPLWYPLCPNGKRPKTTFWKKIFLRGNQFRTIKMTGDPRWSWVGAWLGVLIDPTRPLGVPYDTAPSQPLLGWHFQWARKSINVVYVYGLSTWEARGGHLGVPLFEPVQRYFLFKVLATLPIGANILS